jgi:hypothetical protein
MSRLNRLFLICFIALLVMCAVAPFYAVWNLVTTGHLVRPEFRRA